MSILVTGGAGFIGSHTVDTLIEQGQRVVVVDDLSKGKRENLNPAAVFFKMDIASRELARVFTEYKPEYVLHLAAQVSVARSLSDPLQDAATNIMGTINLLENCRANGVRKVVFASSAAVYGDPQETVLSESLPSAPLSCYGVSKLTVEHYLSTYHHLYNLNFTVLRYANVYGPRQDFSGEGGVVAIFADRIAAAQQPVIYGDGEQTRDFIFVADVAAANILALRAGNGCVMNIGTGQRISVNKLYEAMADIAGSSLKPIMAPARAGDIRHSCMDNSRAVAALGWQPEVSLLEGLTKTIG